MKVYDDDFDLKIKMLNYNELLLPFCSTCWYDFGDVVHNH